MGQESSKGSPGAGVSTASLGKFVKFLNDVYNGLPETPACTQGGMSNMYNFIIYTNPTDLKAYRNKVKKTIPIFQEKHFQELTGRVFDWFLISGKLYFVQPRGTWLQFGTDDVTDLNRIFNMYKDKPLEYMASGTLKKTILKTVSKIMKNPVSKTVVQFNFDSLAWRQFTREYHTDKSEALIDTIKGIFQKLGYKAEYTDDTLLKYIPTEITRVNQARSLGFIPTYFRNKDDCVRQYEISKNIVAAGPDYRPTGRPHPDNGMSSDEDDDEKNRPHQDDSGLSDRIEYSSMENPGYGGAKRRRKSKSPRRKTIRRRSKSTRRSRSHSRK